MIKEEECNVGLPSPVDDRDILPMSKWATPNPGQSTTSLLPMTQVIRSASRILPVLKAPSLSHETLDAYEIHFTKCIDSIHGQQWKHLRDYVDPIELLPVMYLQNARLMLHRNNLAPLCGADVRSKALDSCTFVARDTAKFLRRCMQEPPAGPQSHVTTRHDTWEKRIVSAASAFLCAHIWRCTLFLCFRLDFENALVCARMSAILGDARPINSACGRYLEFYLEELAGRLKEGINFDTNEEMIAYVSGDLQGNYEKAWIWQETVGDVRPSNFPEDHDVNGTVPTTNGITHDNDAWDGWQGVLQTLDHLRKEQEHEPTSTTTMHDRSGSDSRPSSIRRISPPDPERLRTMAQSPEGQAAREKMRIKDLI